MDHQRPLTYLGYAISIIFFALGVYVIIFIPPTAPQKLRIMLGVFLMAWGVYRFVRIKGRERKTDDVHPE